MIASGQSYRDITVYLDGCSFTNCIFERCVFIYSGQMGVHLDSNSFVNCSWEFAGPASATLAFMSVMNNAGAADIVDQIMAGIKKQNGLSTRRPGQH